MLVAVVDFLAIRITSGTQEFGLNKSGVGTRVSRRTVSVDSNVDSHDLAGEVLLSDEEVDEEVVRSNDLEVIHRGRWCIHRCLLECGVVNEVSPSQWNVCLSIDLRSGDDRRTSKTLEGRLLSGRH